MKEYYDTYTFSIRGAHRGIILHAHNSSKLPYNKQRIMRASPHI